MGYLLIAVYLAAAAGLCYLAIAYRNGSRKLSVSAAAPAEDRRYWDAMTKRLKKAYFAAAAGGLLAAISVALKMPLPAEVGCITFLAALVFGLAMLSHKTDFHPCEETLKLQKKWQLWLLAASFSALFLTQLIFQYFV